MQRFLAGETLEKKAYCQKLGLSARKFERHLSTLEALGLNIQHLRLDPLDQRKIYLNLHSVKSGSSLYQEIGEGFIRGQGPKNLYITTQPFRQISAQEESLMIRIFPVIGQRVLRFFYADTCRRVEPYGLIYRMGYLYLRGREGDKLKTWRLDRISSLMVSDELCQIPAGYSLKAEMEEGSGIFIDRQPWEVIIEIRGDALSFFKKETYLSTQKILEQDLRKMKISFLINHEDEFLHFVKAWLPNVRILSPPSLSQKLTDILEAGLGYQRA